MYSIFRKTGAALVFLLGLHAITSAASAAEILPFEAEEISVSLPAGWFMGEVAGLEINSQGHMFVFNRGHHPLLEFGPDGSFVREIGQGLFKVPHGLRIDREDNIWVTDQETHRVLKFNPKGDVAMVLGRDGFPGTGWYDRGYSITLLKSPSDVAWDSTGNIYVADAGNFRIVKFNPYGELIKAWGQKGEKEGDFNFPHSLVMDGADHLYVTDRENGRIQVFSEDGTFLKAWTGFGHPYVIQRDGKGFFWVTDTRAGRLLQFDKQGSLLGTFGQWGKEIGDFGFPHGFAVAPSGAIFVGELSNWRIQKLTR